MDSLQRRELMMEALKQTSQYGLELVEACGNASGCLRQGKDQEGGQILRDILNGIGLISQALDMTDELRREVNADLSLNDLPPILAPLVEALENGDFSLVGDILDYEVSPVLSRWSRELTERLPDIGQP